MGSPELWHRGSTKIAITVPNRLVRRVSCCGSFKWVLRAAALYASEFPALPFLCRKDKGGLHYLEEACLMIANDSQTAKKGDIFYSLTTRRVPNECQRPHLFHTHRRARQMPM